jgi:hypothetical protein
MPADEAAQFLNSMGNLRHLNSLHSICVMNIPGEATDEDVRVVFQAYDACPQIINLGPMVPTNDTQAAFVTFRHPQAVQQVRTCCMSAAHWTHIDTHMPWRIDAVMSTYHMLAPSSNAFHLHCPCRGLAHVSMLTLVYLSSL